MCKKIPQQAALALAISALALFIIAIIEFVYASQLGENALLKIIKETAFSMAAGHGVDGAAAYEEQIKKAGLSPFQVVGVAFASLTLTAMLFAIITALCATKCCPRNKLWKCIAVIWITATCCIFFGLGIALLSVGGAIAVPNYDQLFNDNCKLVAQGKYDQVWPKEARGMFELFGEVDAEFKKGINSNMCTELCVCEGESKDQWYKDYKKIPKRLANNKRVFAKPNDWKAGDPKPMSWTDGDEDREEFSSKSMRECMDNVEDNANKRADYDYNQARAAGKTKSQASDIKKQSLVAYDAIAQAVEDKKPSHALTKFLEHIETNFDCAGICSAPLFYFTKPITEGPPKRGCITPMVANIAPALSRLGQVLIVSGVLIILMIFCALPICCLKRDVGIFEDEDDEDYKEQEGTTVQ